MGVEGWESDYGCFIVRCGLLFVVFRILFILSGMVRVCGL